MSRDHREIGKIELVANTDIEAYAKKMCEELDITVYEDEYLESFLDEMYREYMVVNKKLYKILKREEKDHYFSNVTENEDGSIDFDVCYYDGGCCLAEAIQRGLKDG